jgi:hypothetical protein
MNEEQEGAGPLFQNSPSCLGRSGDLRSFASRLRAVFVVLGLRAHTLGRSPCLRHHPASSGLAAEQEGAGPLFRNSPSFLGCWGDLRSFASRLISASVDLGRCTHMPGRSPCFRRHPFLNPLGGTKAFR